jgi:hypothetical protein
VVGVLVGRELEDHLLAVLYAAQVVRPLLLDLKAALMGHSAASESPGWSGRGHVVRRRISLFSGGRRGLPATDAFPGAGRTAHADHCRS